MEYLASTSEQWLGSGYPVTVELYLMGNGEYHVEFCIEDIDEFHSQYLRVSEYFSSLPKHYDSLDSVNEMIREELGRHCMFEEDECGNVYGW